MSPPSSVEMTALLGEFIGEHKFRFEDEDALQRGIAEALHEFDVEREFKIDSRSRIDFLVTGAGGARIGVEVKVAGAAPDVERQCKRYLNSDIIDGLVLATTRRRHKSIRPDQFDKPLVTIWLGNSGL
jgi:hypothetical protein